MELSDENCWDAAVRNDVSFENVFYLCVKTTGIYCKPTCRARMPKRENVVFVETPEEAVASGFRACKRCKPLEPETNFK